MVLINEWLPNPKGADAAGEWVELWNNGKSPVSLSSWTITNSHGTAFKIADKMISGGEYLVLSRKETKLSLKNADERITLFDAAGHRVDSSAFMGTAQEGKSFSRFGDLFSFGEPTPGVVNKASERALILEHHPLGEVIGAVHPSFALGAMTGVALVLAVVCMVIIKRHAYISSLLFPRDEAPRRTDSQGYFEVE